MHEHAQGANAPQPMRGACDYEFALAFRDAQEGTLVPVVSGVWRQWTGCRWVEVPRKVVRGELWHFVYTVPTSTSKKGANLNDVRGVYDAASTLRGWLVTDDQFDTDPYLVNLENGVLDLRTRELHAHAPEFWQTLQRPFRFEREAKCPEWEKFLSQVLVTADGQPDPELVRVMQEWFGYCLVPVTAAQKACVWYGNGANGKGVATQVLQALVGKENHVPFNLAGLGRDHARAHLAHKLLAVASEVPSKGVVEDATFKAIVAGDDITARFLYEQPFSYRPLCRILLTCNNLPTTTDRSHAYFRRFLIVPFNAVITEERQDKGLVDKLLAELPGIFNWALDGLQRLEANDWRFSQSSAMAGALREYQRDSDSVALWVEDRVEVVAGGEVESGRLYADYKQWTEDNGHKLVASNGLTKRLKLLFPEVRDGRSPVNGARVRCVKGLRLLD